MKDDKDTTKLMDAYEQVSTTKKELIKESSLMSPIGEGKIILEDYLKGLNSII